MERTQRLDWCLRRHPAIVRSDAGAASRGALGGQGAVTDETGSAGGISACGIGGGADDNEEEEEEEEVIVIISREASSPLQALAEALDALVSFDAGAVETFTEEASFEAQGLTAPHSPLIGDEGFDDEGKGITPSLSAAPKTDPPAAPNRSGERGQGAERAHTSSSSRGAAAHGSGAPDLRRCRTAPTDAGRGDAT